MLSNVKGSKYSNIDEFNHEPSFHETIRSPFSPFQLNQRKLQCYRYAPKRLSQQQKHQLCGDGSHGIYPTKCASGVIHFVPSNMNLNFGLVEFCKSSPSRDIPSFESGLCLGKLLSSNHPIPYSEAFQICYNATNIHPALCTINVRAPDHWPSSFLYQLCGQKNGTTEKAKCANAMIDMKKKQFSMKDILLVCQNVNSNFDSSCIQNKYLINVPAFIIAELCKYASAHLNPIHCFRKVTLSSDILNAQLCSSSSSHAPAMCAKHVLRNAQHQKWQRQRQEITEDMIVDLCHDANIFDGHNGTMPSKCVQDLNSQSFISLHTAIQLCQRSKTIHPFNCFVNAYPMFQNETLAMKVCQKSEQFENTLSCLHKAPHSFPMEEKANLCYASINDLPGVCASTIWDVCFHKEPNNFALYNCHFQPSIITELCSNASDIGPAICFLNAPKKLLSNEKVELCINQTLDENKWNQCHLGTEPSDDEQCNSIKNDHVVIKKKSLFPIFDCITYGLEKNLPTKLIVNLCRGSNDHSNAMKSLDCALHVPFEFTPYETLLLCKGARDESPNECVKASYRLSLTTFQRAILCHGGLSTYDKIDTNATMYAPIQCMQLIQNVIGIDESLRLCSGVSNTTPAYCAMSLPVSYDPWNIDHCRDAVSNASQLIVHSMTNKRIYPGERFGVNISINDQFGQKRIWDNSTKVVATLPLNKENLIESSILGIVSFRDIVMIDVGIYTMRFCILKTKQTKNDLDESSLHNCTIVKIKISSTTMNQ